MSNSEKANIFRGKTKDQDWAFPMGPVSPNSLGDHSTKCHKWALVRVPILKIQIWYI